MSVSASVIKEEELFRLKDGLGYKLSRAARVVQKRVDAALEPFSLTRLSWSIVASIAYDNCKSPSELAEHVGLERAAVSRFLRTLEADGILHRVMNKSDQRGTIVRLTRKGSDLAARIPPITRAAMAPCFDCLSAEQTHELHGVLELIGSIDGTVWTD